MLAWVLTASRPISSPSMRRLFNAPRARWKDPTLDVQSMSADRRHEDPRSGRCGHQYSPSSGKSFTFLLSLQSSEALPS